VVIMLAAASIGAVFSSCSPDFGVQGVIDRFGQIEPKILFVTDGYWYNDKPISISEKRSEVASLLSSVEKVIVVPFLSEVELSEDFETWPNFIDPFEAETDID